ncbi:dihydrolipoyl dehydrogenase [Desulfovirgula thermocuniculi]|uniref:dihydrolipoyl dehydrogenase n=1 Tax=Desulfovirgula thermocuniculi TaxID=348842 RepID=UPI00040C530B|nr:dihydrolipoyl dehydrogenase [Desulfovirgula thermocuniculi]
MSGFDVVVVGGGPGGYVAALRAAREGLKVALVEEREVGGTCLHLGCIPTKALHRTAFYLQCFKHFERNGISAELKDFSLAAAVARKEGIVKKLTAGIHYLLKKNGVAFYRGKGTVVDRGEVEVVGSGGSERLKAQSVIIATGSAPQKPPGFPFDGETVLTSDEALSLKELPRSLAVVGGGVIGCELAGIFHAFGCRVTVIELQDGLLPAMDEDVGKALGAAFRKRGIEVKLKARVAGVEKTGRGALVELDSGEVLEVEKVLVAVGRRYLSREVARPELNLALGPRGEIATDERTRTSVPGIYAVGDVTGKRELAHVAAHQGVVAALNAAGYEAREELQVVPAAVFTFPEAAGVGLTERDLLAQGVRTFKFPFSALGKAVTMDETEGFVKVVADTGGVVRGVHIVGPHAADLVATAALLVKAGFKAGEAERLIFAHPTLPEALKEALEGIEGTCLHL